MTDQAAVDKKIMEGYEFLSKNETAKACDIWLDAWEGLKVLMSEGGMESVHDINNKYSWSDFPSNYVQELEAELHNAGLEDPEYYQKRIGYCHELLRYVGEDKLMEENTHRAIADSYFEIGDSAECDRLYRQWLKDDPKWGWGYLGWFMCYESTYHGRQDIAKAGEIIKRALGEADVRNRLAVVDRALVYYEEHGGNATEIASLREEFSRLAAASPGHQTYHKPIPVTSAKVGRNDPCPCGSGKKYKKCHGMDGAV